jgi:hypothetical protein
LPAQANAVAGTLKSIVARTPWRASASRAALRALLFAFCGVLSLQALAAKADRPETGMKIPPTLGYGGGLVVLDGSGVRVSSLELRVEIGRQEYSGYVVRSRYVLNNAGPATKALVGVPVAWHRWEFRENGTPGPNVFEHLKDVKIVVAGRAYQCEPWNARPGTFSPSIWQGVTVEGWCAVLVDVPSGADVPASLQVPGWFRVRGNWSAARLWYSLFPRPSDDYRVKRVSVSIDLGPAARRLVHVLSPGGGALRKGRVEWEWSDVATNSVPAIEMDVDWTVQGRRPELLLRSGVGMSASSTGPGGARHPLGVGTAGGSLGAGGWCSEDATQAAVLEVSLGAADRGLKKCALYDFVVVTGRPETERAWREAGVLQEGRVESCSHPEDGFEFDKRGYGITSKGVRIQPESRKDDPALARTEILPPAGVLANEHDCFRLIPLGGRSRTKPGWCVSEFTPRVLCQAVKTP